MVTEEYQVKKKSWVYQRRHGCGYNVGIYQSEMMLQPTRENAEAGERHVNIQLKEKEQTCEQSLQMWKGECSCILVPRRDAGCFFLASCQQVGFQLEKDLDGLVSSEVYIPWR